MASYGRSVLERVGMSISVSADGNPEVKAGGITIGWGAITAVSADAEVRPEGETVNTSFYSNQSPADDFIYAGEKFIRYGTIMCRVSGGTYDQKFVPYGTSGTGGTLLFQKGDAFILNRSVHDYSYNSDHDGQAFEGGLVWKNRVQYNIATVQTLTFTATGGTLTYTYKGATTAGVAYNANAATIQTALEGLSTIGTGKVTVTGTGPFTITLSDDLGAHQLIVLGTGSLTGGSATIAATAGATAGLVGPNQSEFDAVFPRIRFVTE